MRAPVRPAGPRRRGPLLSPCAWLGLLVALVTLLLAAPASSADEMLLYAGPLRMQFSDSIIGYFTPFRSPSFAVVHQMQGILHTVWQDKLDPMDVDYRWGGFFSDVLRDYLRTARGIAGLGPGTRLLILPNPVEVTLPTVIELSAREVALQSSPHVALLPSPGRTKYLAALATSKDAADMLVEATLLTGQPPEYFLLHLTHSSPVATRALGRLDHLGGGSLLATPAFEGGFFFVKGTRIGRINALTGAVTALSVVLPAPAVEVLATRLLTDQASCPEADLIVVLDDGTLMVLLCVNSVIPEAPPIASHALALPGRTGTGTGRLLNPGLPSIGQDRLPFVYYMWESAEAGASLWRMDLRLSPLAWTKVTLPAVVPASGILDQAHLLRLYAEGLQDRWAVVVNHVALLEAEDFGCSTDPTISCAGPNGPNGTQLGWTCRLGHTESPYSEVGRLCSGCLDGFYPDEAVSTRPCAPCPPGCLGCGGGSCLLCEESLLLEPSGPGQEARCVAACSAGFQRVAKGCLPDERPARAEVALPATLVAIQQPDAVSALGETHLAICDDGKLCLPEPVEIKPFAPRRGLLLTDQHNGIFLARSQDASQADVLSPVQIELTVPGTLFERPTQAVIEVGPFFGASGAKLALVFCRGPERLWMLHVSCPNFTSGSPNAWGPFVAEHYIPLAEAMPGCQTLRRLDAHTVVIHHDVAGGGLLTINEDLSHSYDGLGASEVVHLPGPEAVPSAGWPRDPGWVFLLEPGNMATLYPRGMHALGNLAQHIRGKALARRDPWHPWTRTLLLSTSVPHARGRQAFELALVRFQAGLWEAALLPGGMLMHGRTWELPVSGQVLARVPGTVAPAPVDVSLLAVDFLPGTEHPSGLVLLAPRLVGLALLRCPATGGACFLLPGRLAPVSLDWLGSASVALLPGGPAPGDVLSLLAVAPSSSPLSGVYRLAFQSTCPESTFGPECRACDPLCRECTGPGPGDCTACWAWNGSSPGVCLPGCPGGQYPSTDGLCGCHATCTVCRTPSDQSNTCEVCNPGFAPLPQGLEGHRCFACDSTCAECTAPQDPGACSRCPAGMWLHAGACLGHCPSGTWPDASDNTCQACVPGCGLCSSSTTCSQCMPSYFMAQEPGQPAGQLHCMKCHPTCAFCVKAESCTACRSNMVFLDPDPTKPSFCGSSCAPGEFRRMGRCAVCAESCALCTGEADHCDVCAEGHFRPDPASPKCAPCPAGCASCTGTRCLACVPGLFLDRQLGGRCVAACPAGMYADVETCQPCDVTCLTCAGPGPGLCTGCAEGLQLARLGADFGACESACPEGRFWPAAGGSCLPCDRACATCIGPSDRDCWRCSGSDVLQDGQCMQECASGHVAVGGRCLPCHPSCQACAGVRSTECLPACPGDLLALPAGQSPMRCVPACPAGYSTTAGGCVKCGDHCASCPDGAGSCALCDRGKLLAESACVSHCPARSSPVGGQCVTCHGLCRACHGPGADQCASCDAEAPLLAGGACYAACPAGFFPQADLCLPCNGTCAACRGPAATECTSCTGALAWMDGACLGACPAGWFPESHVCKRCPASCDTCTQPLTCATCRPGELLDLAGACVASCPAGSHPCLDSGRCLACPGGCAACESANGTCTAQCTGCRDGFVLSAGRCVQACPAGEFAPPGQASCAPCQASCKTCSTDGGLCTSCPGGLLLTKAGTCVGACPADSWPVDGACLACPDGCQRCEAGPEPPRCAVAPGGALTCPGIPTCAQCAPDLWLLAGAACVEACPVGHFPDWQATVPACAACHGTCSAGPCIGPAAEDCSGPGPGTGARRLGLAIGLSVGLLLLLILLILLVLFCVRRRAGRAATGKDLADAEDATMLNTIVELALPGAILVGVDTDFRPLDEQLGAGTQASVYAAQAVGAGIVARLGCPDVVAVKKMRTEAMSTDRSSVLVNTLPELNAMTVRYAAPEVIGAFQRGISLDRAAFLPADIFSAAVMLLECLTRAVPWPDLDMQGIVSAVKAGQRPDTGALPTSGAFSNAGDLVAAAWQADAGRRPLAASFRQQCVIYYVAAGGLSESP
ncbi:hypothetical protein H696_03231 [Fonticula alba]|uniref:EGF-like domain-containing protein n=1 Tax=Fonticula alba TaxID=691883 RepID=A0A058Z6N6_FONAL|nr:hypothetical protein H696_03231 [Fonticula alba]KCV69786.1 hypothetical protein H696_03231 [Fonticula alba]|eukprot:XP_009495392.1 hypothetical protein H696_03231 [Fonticula alba]